MRNRTTGNKGLLVVTLLALVSFFIGACVPITPVAVPATPQAGTTPVATEEASALTLEGITWQLVSYSDANGATATPTAESTITLQAGQASGSAGCNRFNSSYTVNGSQLTFGQAASTMMACVDPAVMTQEQAFLANLGKVASFEITEEQLHLLDAGGATLLSFEQQVSPTLTSVLWEATNYNNGRQAVVSILDGTKITALFGEDGSLSGSAGCNNYVTSYTAAGGKISIKPAATTRMMCSAPEGIMEQEAAYAKALETAATYTIQGDILEMRTADDAMVARYQAAGPATEATATEEPVTDTAEIVGVPWQWVETHSSDDSILKPADSSQYTMTLEADGKVSLQADCNQGAGTYTLNGQELSLNVAATTRMACPAGSLADRYITQLNAAATFVMDGEDLILNLFADAGNMRFSRIK